MQTSYGRETIPRTRLATSLDTLFDLYKKYPESSFNRSEFIAALDLSPNSGGPDHKLASLRLFGLIVKDVKDAKYRITDLGRTIVNSKGQDLAVAIETVINHVGPWASLYATFRKIAIDDEKFASIFKASTDASDADIRDNLVPLKNAYKEDIDCINKEYPFSIWSSRVRSRQPRMTSHQKSQQLSIDTNLKVAGENNKDFFSSHNLVFSYGGTQIHVIDASSIALARLVIDEKEKELQLGRK